MVRGDDGRKSLSPESSVNRPAVSESRDIEALCAVQ